MFPCPRTFRPDSEELSGACAPPPRSEGRQRERKLKNNPNSDLRSLCADQRLLRIAIKFLCRRVLRHPGQRRMLPDLKPGDQIVTLCDRAGANVILCGIVTGIGCIQTRSAIATKGLHPAVSALRRFHIFLRHTPGDPKRVSRNKGNRSERRRGKRLTIRAVANPVSFGVYLRLIGNRPTMTCTVDFHRLNSSPARSVRGNDKPSQHKPKWWSKETGFSLSRPRSLQTIEHTGRCGFS